MALCRSKLCLFALALAVLAAGGSNSVRAHPHVWVDVQTKLLFDKQGLLTGFRHVWQFDEGYSAFAVTGLDKNKDGKLSKTELAPLAKVNMESLGEFGYFTHLTLDGKPGEMVDPIKFELVYKKGRAILDFILPLKKPVDGRRRNIAFAVYDPTIYVDFKFAKDKPLSLAVNAPGLCRIDYKPPQDVAAKESRLSEYSEADFNNPDLNINFDVQSEDMVRLLCGKTSR